MEQEVLYLGHRQRKNAISSSQSPVPIPNKPTQLLSLSGFGRGFQLLAQNQGFVLLLSYQ